MEAGEDEVEVVEVVEVEEEEEVRGIEDIQACVVALRTVTVTDGARVGTEVKASVVVAAAAATVTSNAPRLSF